MSLSDVLIILATALSPLIAVQVTRYLANQNEIRDRKLWIFKTLMATRAQSLSPMHVEALNRIDLEFSAKSKKEKAVLDVWAQLLDHLGNDKLSAEAWSERRVDLLIELLHSMGSSLGYAFNKTQIKNGIYAPIGHSRMETEQEQIRQLVLELLSGNRSLPMDVTSFPGTEPASASASHG